MRCRIASTDESLAARLRRWGRDPSILLPALVAVAATVAAAVVARHGALVTPDSVVYLSSAHNVGTGRGPTIPFTTYTSDLPPLDAVRFGLSVPLTDYPPLVPLILGSLVPLGVAPLTLARALHVVLLGVSVWLLGRLAVKALGPRRWPWAVGIQIAVVLGPIAFRRFPFLMLYTAVLSEPLMFTFSLASLLCLVVARERRSSLAFWAAVVLAGGAAGCRFAGAATVITVSAVALVEVEASWWRRLFRSAAAGVIGLVPAMGAVAVSQHRLGRPARALRPLDLGAIPHEMASGLTAILWPPSWSHTTRVAVLVALLAVLVADLAWGFARRWGPPSPRYRLAPAVPSYDAPARKRGTPVMRSRAATSVVMALSADATGEVPAVPAAGAGTGGLEVGDADDGGVEDDEGVEVDVVEADEPVGEEVPVGRGPVAWVLRLGTAATEPARTVVVAFVVSYVVVFVGARAFTDRNIPLDGRMLDGVLGPALVLAAVILTLPPLRSVLGALSVAAGLGGFAVLAGPAAPDLGHLLRAGYTPDAGRAAYAATFPRLLEGTPDDLPVFTNLPDIVYLSTGRATYFVPCDRDYFAHEPNPGYDQQVADLVRLVQEGRAALILEDASRIRPGCLSGSTLPPGLEKTDTFPGGAAYAAGG